MIRVEKEGGDLIKPRRIRRSHRRLAFAGALFAASVLGLAAPVAGFAADQAAAPAQEVNTCPDRAARAKSIAEDRDAGIPQDQEMHKLREQVSGSPPEQQVRAMSLLSVLVQRIYGMYTNVPPQTIYARYLQYCKSRWPDDARAQ
jgi:hypothetical protein